MGAGLVSIHRAQTSFSEDAVLTTNYLDDYIVRGKVFNITISEEFTADTAVYFTSEYAGEKPGAAFLLPITFTPVSGYVTLNIYEDTDYTGGTALTAVDRNRATKNTSLVSVKTGASGTDKGTLIKTVVVGTAAAQGSAGSEGGGSGSSANSLIFDTGVKYLYEVTCSETAVVGINAEFAEI